MALKHRKIVLLNPPYYRSVLRDYYCSTFPKAPYYWQPIDLLSVAAMLNGKADILMIDAVARWMTAKQAKKIIDEFDPRAIYILSSTLTGENDLALAKRLKAPGRQLVLGGEMALDLEFDFKRFDFIDGLLLDFTDVRATGLFTGGACDGRLRTPTYSPSPPAVGERYAIGVMPHQFLNVGPYRMPLWRGPFYSLLTDFGCPFACAFCNSGRHSLGFKLRDLAEIAEEARQLKKLGAEKIFIKDMTFGADLAHAEAVLSILAPYGFRLRGYLRADLVTPAFAKILKASGFELAQIGVERPCEQDRYKLRKGIKDDIIVNAFQILQSQGIAAGAHFILGFEGDHVRTIADCLSRARAIGAAYCSINMYQHRRGTSPLPAISGWGRQCLSIGAGLAMAGFNINRQINYLRRHNGLNG